MEFSKGEVNRAGVLWAQLYARWYDVGEAAMDEFDRQALDAASAAILWWRSLHARPMTSVTANLRYYLKEQPGSSRPTQRLKTYRTLVDKLVREPTMELTQMADVGGCRAILPTQAAVTAVSRRLRKNWDVRRTRDYVAAPKKSGYRAVHHIVRRRGRLVEVQLRTPWQDTWANQVEADTRRLGVGLKSGVGPALVHDYYVAVSELFALRESGQEPDEAFNARLIDRYRRAQPYLMSATTPKEGA